MTTRAESSIFWPGMSKDIASTRARCHTCNGIAPSQASMPPVQPASSCYPFQQICADFFHHLGNTYLVIVDRYSHWPIVTHSKEGAKALTTVLRETFATYGIPDTLTSDGGPQFSSHLTANFLKAWNVEHRISSAYNPHANCRAEHGVKTMKRLIAGNTTSNGDLAVDKFHKAILQYRNSPDPYTQRSASSVDRAG